MSIPVFTHITDYRYLINSTQSPSYSRPLARVYLTLFGTVAVPIDPAIDDAGSREAGARAELRFYQDGIDLPANICIQEEGLPLRVKYVANYYLRYFEPIIDMLRNENPVYFHFTSNNYASLRTDAEPVGEEE